MKIVMLTFVAAGKGAYWRAFHFARHLVQNGHEVTLLVMARRERVRVRQERVAGVQVVHMPDLLWGPLRSGWDPWETARRIAWLRRRRFDLVHVFDLRPTNLFPALYLGARGMPLVVDWEDWFGRGGSVEERPNRFLRTVLRPVETFFEERFRRRADATTVICSTLRERAVALGVPAETITLIRDGADVQGLQPLDKEQCRRRLDLPVQTPLIGFVGAIFRRDAQLMAAAFDQLRESWPEAHLVLIGYFNAPIETMVQEPATIMRTGPVTHPQLNQFLAACDVCWLPLRNSGANRGRWPMKLNDYMCVGRPTVATRVGDVTAVMQEHKIGLLAPDTAEAMARQTGRLLAEPDLARRLGENGRLVAETTFNWQLRTAELEAVYENVLARCSDLPL